MKRQIRNRRVLLTGIFVMSLSCLFAQQTFKYQAGLQKVTADGFYRINLDPELIARSNADFTDIRVLDQNKHFVPYIFGTKLILKDQQSFINFPSLTVPEGKSDTTTTFIAENADRLTINQLNIQLRNASVERIVNLSGSDDLKKWYAIKENIYLEEAGEMNDLGTYQQALNFPSSTYRYLKIQINNKNKEPVAILKAGVYQEQTAKPVYIQLKDAALKQKDSAQLSSVTVRFDQHYQLNKLHLELTGQKYYQRNIRIYEINGKLKNLIADKMIRSSEKTDFYLSIKTSLLLLEILNGDNPPLTVKTVKGYQLEQSLVSYLEKDKQYYLLCGDQHAAAPDYDLKFFKDSLQKQLVPLTHKEVVRNSLYKEKKAIIKQAKRDKIPSWAIWVAIAAVVVVLGLLTFKMTQEVNNRSKEEDKSSKDY